MFRIIMFLQASFLHKINTGAKLKGGGKINLQKLKRFKVHVNFLSVLILCIKVITLWNV